MATWVTHLMIADRVMKDLSGLDRRGFCAGNIAPDCNVENADWTDFTPSRQVTHWMNSEKKMPADCEAFLQKYVLDRGKEIVSAEELSFLLGYYSHLITDAAFQWYIRNEKRVQASWERLLTCDDLREKAAELPASWDSVKKLIPTKERMREIYSMEAEYLQDHPDSGYLTEILPMKEFPDYIDYLPHGAIVRKIGVMGYLPERDENVPLITMSKEEFLFFAEDTARLITEKIRKALEKIRR